MTLFSQRPLLLSLACCLTLTACDDDRIHNICSQYPALCADLVDDGWCRYERSDVIRGRYYLQEEGTDRRKVRSDARPGALSAVRRALHQYRVQACQGAEEPQSGRDAGRRPSTGATGRTDRGSQDPYLLLWHWTNNTSPEARASTLAQEGTPSLEEPELQLALGGIYAKSEPEKAIRLMHHALSLYREGTRSTAGSHRPQHPLHGGRSDLIRPICGAR